MNSKTANPRSKRNSTQVDEQTGEMPYTPIQTDQQIVISAKRPPSIETINSINAVAGQNPPSANLRDHPELDNQVVAVSDCVFSNGEYGPFVILTCWKGDGPYKQSDCMILITGSGNIIERMAVTKQSNAFPVIGRFRKSGRAWFLDGKDDATSTGKKEEKQIPF